MTYRNPENYDPDTLAELQRQERAFDARVRAFIAEVGESHDSIRASLDRIAEADAEHRQDGQNELDRETAERDCGHNDQRIDERGAIVCDECGGEVGYSAALGDGRH